MMPPIPKLQFCCIVKRDNPWVKNEETSQMESQQIGRAREENNSRWDMYFMRGTYKENKRGFEYASTKSYGLQ